MSILPSEHKFRLFFTLVWQWNIDFDHKILFPEDTPPRRQRNIETIWKKNVHSITAFKNPKVLNYYFLNASREILYIKTVLLWLNEVTKKRWEVCGADQYTCTLPLIRTHFSCYTSQFHPVYYDANLPETKYSENSSQVPASTSITVNKIRKLCYRHHTVQSFILTFLSLTTLSLTAQRDYLKPISISRAATAHWVSDPDNLHFHDHPACLVAMRGQHVDSPSRWVSRPGLPL